MRSSPIDGVRAMYACYALSRRCSSCGSARTPPPAAAPSTSWAGRARRPGPLAITPHHSGGLGPVYNGLCLLCLHAKPSLGLCSRKRAVTRVPADLAC